MAFFKYAHATTTQPSVDGKGWGKVRTAATEGPSENLIHQASEILEEDFDPKKYLLTHATIVCSADIEEPVEGSTRLGKVLDPMTGTTINRAWPQYRVKPECDNFINNNNDLWPRDVLMKSFQTFVGGHNFVEHVQKVEESKGRIIDAVARDIGPSTYVDILIATSRKHASLIADIESGRTSTLSMGCFLEGTQVTMANGTRVAIEEVVPGDMVLTHRGRAREVLNKQIRPYVGEMRYIKAVGVSSTIRATANHGFYVLRAPKVCACGCGEAIPETSTLTRRMTRRLKVGHQLRIYNPNGTYSLEEARARKEKVQALKGYVFEKVRADELEEGDFLAFPKAQTSTDSLEGWTTGKARLAGYFLAEGSYLKHKGVKTEIQFNFSMGEKDTYVQEVVELLKQEFPGRDPWVQDRPERDTCVVHLYGKEVAAWFQTHCGEYSWGKKLSEDLMSLPVELQKHLLGTWINGDGHYSEEGKNLSGTTVSYDMACQMHQLMAQCGVFSRMTCQQDGRHIELAQAVGQGWVPNPETGKRPALTLTIGLTCAQVLKGFSDKVGRKSQAEQQLRVLDNYVIFPVTSIEKGWHEGVVHNMEVEEDHTYLVEGVTAFNCSVTETQCTKCGNVAADETDMCGHIRYEKGNYFHDSRGQRHRIAEICGHNSIDPTGGVHFIEASWVATPAFGGAVMRNILTPNGLNPESLRQAQEVLNSPPPQWTHSGLPRAAGVRVAELPSPVATKANVASYPGSLMAEMDDPMSFEEEDEEKSPAPEPKQKPLDQLADDVYKTMIQRVNQRVQDDMRGPKTSPGEVAHSTGDDIIKQGFRKAAYQLGLKTLVRSASSDAHLMDSIAQFNAENGVNISRALYRIALQLGPMSKYGSVESWAVQAHNSLHRTPTLDEVKTLLRLGSLLDQRSSFSSHN